MHDQGYPFRHEHHLCEACIEYARVLEQVEELRAWLEREREHGEHIPIASVILGLPVVPADATLASRRRLGFFDHLRASPVEPGGAARVASLLGKRKP
jgi:hypothetical protein